MQLRFAGTFADAAAIHAAMLAVDRRHVEDGLAHRSSPNSDEADETTRGEPAGTPAEDIDADSLVTYAVDIRKRLVMLASMRNLDELQSMLDANADAPERGRLASNWERFDRQLHRWLDAGAPVVPPLAETMALLPRRRQLDRVSWSASRARSRAQQDAKNAAAAAADSDDPAKIAALLQAENERRGLVNSPFVLAMGVEVIRKERRSLGRFRSAAAVVKVVASMGSGFAREVKHHPDPPDWMQPPQRASYEVPCAQSATAVRLDVGARDIVERAAAGDRRAVLFTSVPIWLTRDPDDASWALAFLGHTRVGRLPLSDGFDQALRAAEFYDEDPVLDGVIWRLGETEPVALQVSNPDYE